MNIVLSQPSTKKTKDNTAQLNKLWQKVQKQRKKNDQLKSQMDQLMQIYQHDILPVETETRMKAQQALVMKLITFFSRKSLAKWHRQEIDHWINHTLHDIAMIDQERANMLGEQYNEISAHISGVNYAEVKEKEQAIHHIMNTALNEHYENLKEEDDEAPDPHDIITRFIKKVLANPDQYKDIDPTIASEVLAASKTLEDDAYEDDWSDLDDDDLDEPNDEAILEELFGNTTSEQQDQTRDKQHHTTNNDFTKPAASIESELDGKWLRTLFRRAAAALHPDRESDPKKREAKQIAMAQLTEARDKQDVLTMINLYTKHASNGDLSIAEQDFETFTRLLKKQLEELEDEQASIIHQNPLNEYLYDHLYADTSAKREKKLKTHLKSIKEEATNLYGLANSLRNLTILKDILRERHDQRREQFMTYFDVDF